MAKNASSAKPEGGILQTPEGRRLLWMVPCGLLLLLLTWIGPGLLATLEPEKPSASTAATATSQLPSHHILDITPGSETAKKSEAGSKPAAPRRARGLRPPPETVSTGELGALLLGVIGLIVGVAFALRKVMRRARLAPGSEKLLQVVDALPLGPKRHVYAVRMRDRLLVLGAGGEDISLLAEYDEEDWSAPATVEAPATAAPVATVAEKPAKAARKSARQRQTAPAATPQPTARARKAYANASGQDRAKARSGTKKAPAGAHRVPPAFRHLLENAVEGEA